MVRSGSGSRKWWRRRRLTASGCADISYRPIQARRLAATRGRVWPA